MCVITRLDIQGEARKTIRRSLRDDQRIRRIGNVIFEELKWIKLKEKLKIKNFFFNFFKKLKIKEECWILS